LTRRGERRVFLFIAVFLFPALFIALVGGYGLLIWLMQFLIGPPGSRLIMTGTVDISRRNLLRGVPVSTTAPVRPPWAVD